MKSFVVDAVRLSFHQEHAGTRVDVIDCRAAALSAELPPVAVIHAGCSAAQGDPVFRVKRAIGGDIAGGIIGERGRTSSVILPAEEPVSGRIHGEIVGGGAGGLLIDDVDDVAVAVVGKIHFSPWDIGSQSRLPEGCQAAPFVIFIVFVGIGGDAIGDVMDLAGGEGGIVRVIEVEAVGGAETIVHARQFQSSGRVGVLKVR